MNVLFPRLMIMNGWPGKRGATASAVHLTATFRTMYLESCPAALDHVLDLGVEEAVGQCHRETLKRCQLMNRRRTAESTSIMYVYFVSIRP